MFRRLVQYFRRVPDHQGAKMSKKEAFDHVKQLFAVHSTIDARLGIALEGLDKHPYKYVPLLYKLQQALTAVGEVGTGDKGRQSFVVVPVMKAKMRSIHLTGSALVEILTRYYGRIGVRIGAEQRKLMSANVRFMWEKFFKIEEFEKRNHDGSYKKVFWHLTTNGVQASLIMKQQKDYQQHKLSMASTQQHNVLLGENMKLPHHFPDFDYVMGIDPGVRLALGGIRYNVRTGARELIKIKSHKLHHDSGLNARNMREKAQSDELQKEISENREGLEYLISLERWERDGHEVSIHVGAEAFGYEEYTDFQLQFMERRINLYKRPVFRRLSFDSYIRRRETIDKTVSSLCPVNARTLLFYGSSKFGPCIRG